MLRELRQRQGLTQKALAEAANLPLRTVQKYEGDECSLSNMTLAKALRLADVLGVHPAELIRKEAGDE